jgi:hypothetical protein
MADQLTPREQEKVDFARRLQLLLAEAVDRRMVVEVRLIPNLPLAMGSYSMWASVREARVLAVPIHRVKP